MSGVAAIMISSGGKITLPAVQNLIGAWYADTGKQNTASPGNGDLTGTISPVSGYYDGSSGATGVINFSAPFNLTEGTCIVVAQYHDPVVNAGLGDGVFNPDPQTNTTTWRMSNTGIGGLVGFNSANGTSGWTVSTGGTAGLSQIDGQALPFVVFGSRFDASSSDSFLDRAWIGTQQSALSFSTLQQFVVNSYYSNGAYPYNNKINAILLWNKKLTESQYSSALTYLKRRARAAGLTVYNAPSKVLAVEGDSISYGTTATTNYSSYSKLNSLFSFVGFGGNSAQPSSTLYYRDGAHPYVSSRWSTFDRLFIKDYDNPSGKVVFSLMIGKNDYGAFSSDALLTGLQTFLQPVYAAGAKVLLSTVLPSTDVGFSTFQSAVNTAIKASFAGNYCTAVWDAAAVANMTDAANTTYYTDGTHPTTAGQQLLAASYASAVNAI